MNKNRGFPAKTAQSYSSIENRASDVRKKISPHNSPTDALPGLEIFESLNKYRIKTHASKAIPLTYEVKPIPIEALARYDEIHRLIVVTLSEQTYADLECEEPRARFSLCHEVGHAVLHVNELRALSQIPHSEAALMRGDISPYPLYYDTEWQADAFSAALLMPASGLFEIEQQGILSSSEIQRRYKVSSPAANIRLANYQKRKNELLVRTEDRANDGY